MYPYLQVISKGRIITWFENILKVFCFFRYDVIYL